MITPNQVTYYKLDASSRVGDAPGFDTLASEHYNKSYDIVADNELNNYSNVTVDFSTDQDVQSTIGGEYESKRLEAWLDETSYAAPDWRFVLADLIDSGKLPKGNYLISVFW